MILILDNYDSFVANVARYFRELGETVAVVRNDAIGIGAPAEMRASSLVISPGPCAPADAGIANDLVRAWSGRIPILGICLGHQCIGEVFGGRIARAREPMHGRSSPIRHAGSGVFAGLPDPLTVGRYHALVVELDRPDGPLAVTARSPVGEIMGLAHRAHPTFGVQFHPESILTRDGHAMLANFLRIARERRAA